MHQLPPLVSIHATRVGGDNGFYVFVQVCARFLSTPPVWVATRGSCLGLAGGSGFYPRHPCGWRLNHAVAVASRGVFLSTPPVWVATRNGYRSIRRQLVSIHATRVGGDFNKLQISSKTVVSIHATRVGGDGTRHAGACAGSCFYPRHPCGWRPVNSLHRLLKNEFLSTPPVWVATDNRRPLWWRKASFYPRHPCGWRHFAGVRHGVYRLVSIHATRVGGDMWTA